MSSKEERVVRRQITGVISSVLAIGLTLAVSVAPAATRAKGNESMRGVIVASDESGARHVVTSLIVARGVFAGAGRIVEVASRPGDPGNLERDDLVFPGGGMHLVTTIKSFTASVNTNTCAVRVRGRQTGRIRGGTGKFRHAVGTFAGPIRGRAVAVRNPDGTCSQQGALLLEVDIISERGSFSF
jgi:hypothetical protein